MTSYHFTILIPRTKYYILPKENCVLLILEVASDAENVVKQLTSLGNIRSITWWGYWSSWSRWLLRSSSAVFDNLLTIFCFFRHAFRIHSNVFDKGIDTETKVNTSNTMSCQDNFASDRIASILPWSPTTLSQRRKLPRLKKASRASPTLRAARFIKNILETKKSLETDMTWIQHFETKKTLGNGLNGLVLDVLHTKNSWKLTWMWFFRFYLFPLLPRPPFSMLQSSLKVS